MNDDKMEKSEKRVTGTDIAEPPRENGPLAMASGMSAVRMTVFVEFDFKGGTAGGPEGKTGERDGWAYIRKDYGPTHVNDLRIRINGTWVSI